MINELTIYKCDSCKCESETQTIPLTFGGLPPGAGWYSVDKNSGGIGTSYFNQLNFCSLNCLQEWTQKEMAENEK